MLTFRCPTCEAVLLAKDKKLVGKILACPKCGSMVQVPMIDDAPAPEIFPATKPVIQKRFPDVLTNETASGIIGPTPKEHLRSNLLAAESAEIPETVSEKEVQTRMFLVGILIGLLILLLLAFGYLMLIRKPAEPVLDPLLQTPIELPVESVPEVPPAVQVSEEVPEPEPVPEVSEPSIPEPAPEPPKEEPAEPELPPADDSLAVFERKMPEVLDNSLPKLDVDVKLALPILELNIEQQSLIGFIQTFSALTDIPITLEIDELQPLGITARTSIACQFLETTAGNVLTSILAGLNLQWTATDRQILISPKSSHEAVDLNFDVSDFIEHTEDLTAEVLAQWIQKLVCPEAKIESGPAGFLKVVPNTESLARKSPKRLQTAILRFLEQLRAIRQLPPKTNWAAETIAPEAFGWDRVMMPITLNYYRAVPLDRIREQFENQTELTILIDHQSLHLALSPYAFIQTAVQCDSGTVNEALESALNSADSAPLTYRIIDDQTLEITTRESAGSPDKMSVEVHRLQLQTDADTKESAEIAQSLRSAVEPGTWYTEGKPETSLGGNIVVDVPSGCIFVRQSQPVQRQIRLYLAGQIENGNPEK